MNLISCGQNSFEKELNGKWFSPENNGFTRFYFYQDSLLLIEDNVLNAKWTANESKIEFDYIAQISSQVSEKDSTKKILHYTLSKKNNLLSFKIKDSLKERNFNLVRAQNYFDFLSKTNNVVFKLPTDSLAQHISLNHQYGFKVFIGTDNGKTIIVSEFGNGIDSIKNDIIKFKQNLKPLDQFHQQKMESEIHFRMFADKSISDKKIEGILQKITQSDIKQAYRIYNSKNFYNFETLLGKRL
ncbi:hypothetical protein [Cellulophaga fucicola]|uniref:hypothetical protein n=1 Tax=Cellulophaga fucicola TaxID=76595 RepID=UPI003EBE41B8